MKEMERQSEGRKDGQGKDTAAGRSGGPVVVRQTREEL